MSLKAFHIVFISCSILLSLGFGVWLVRQYLESGEWLWLAGGILSFAAAVSLVFYGTCLPEEDTPHWLPMRLHASHV